MKLCQLRDLVATAANRYDENRNSKELSARLMDAIEAYKMSPAILGTYYVDPDSTDEAINVVATFYEMPRETLTFTFAKKAGKFFYSYQNVGTQLGRMKLVLADSPLPKKATTDAPSDAIVPEDGHIVNPFAEPAKPVNDTPIVRPRARTVPPKRSRHGKRN